MAIGGLVTAAWLQTTPPRQPSGTLVVPTPSAAGQALSKKWPGGTPLATPKGHAHICAASVEIAAQGQLWGFWLAETSRELYQKAAAKLD